MAAKKRTPRKPFVETALAPIAAEFGVESAGIGKKLAKGARNIADAAVDTTKFVRAALFPLRVLVYGAQKVEKHLIRLVSEKLQTVPPDQRCVPPNAVLGPIVESARLRMDEPDFADMFANLLATAMDQRTATDAHPSFAKILGEIVSDEAKILRHLHKVGYEALVDLESGAVDGSESRPGLENLSMVAIDASATVLGAAPVLIANLVRLGLVTAPIDEELADESRYLRLEQSPPLVALKNYIVASGRRPICRRRLIRLAPLGEAFLRACLPAQR